MDQIASELKEGVEKPGGGEGRKGSGPALLVDGGGRGVDVRRRRGDGVADRSECVSDA